MEQKIDVYMMRVENGKPCKGYIDSIENTLYAKQRYVEGLIQVVSLNSEIDVICNDEGKLMKLNENRAFIYGEEVLDIFVGNILACRHDNEGNFTSISPEDIPVIEQSLIPVLHNGIFGVYLIEADKIPEYSQRKGVQEQ